MVPTRGGFLSSVGLPTWTARATFLPSSNHTLTNWPTSSLTAVLPLVILVRSPSWTSTGPDGLSSFLVGTTFIVKDLRSSAIALTTPTRGSGFSTSGFFASGFLSSGFLSAADGQNQ